MTEHEKRIREALEAGPQAWSYDSNMRPFYNDPEGHSRGGEFDGTYTLFGADFEVDGEVYEGPTLSERCKEADAKYIAACNPAAIRALLADLDAVRADAQRYRYLRDVAWGDGSLVFFDHRYDKDEWDAKIDAALKGATA